MNGRPRLIIVVDTEEEFDWDAGFDRRNTTVRAMAGIGRFQDVCDAFLIRPTYVVDYPVATQEEGFRPLRSFNAEIGAHLHPWVNPPHEEEVTRANSYPGNLPGDLEARKLSVLRQAIEANLGVRPLVYRAGRYGFGPSTASILEEQGFEVDLSVCPPMDFRADGGPDFTRAAVEPCWFGTKRRLLEIPVTGAFVGLLAPFGARLHALTQAPAMRAFRVPGVFSRLRLLERIRLSPEGHTLPELIRLTRALLRRGVGIFSFGLHSPTLMPGYTTYVRSTADRDAFLETCRGYFRYFLEELGGEATTPLAFKRQLEAESAA